jgi:putative phosphoesterase
MTKIFIMSDSHRLTNEVEMLKEKHRAEVDFMIHCGDSELSSDRPELAGFVTVRGNCDHDMGFPEEAVVEAGGRKIFVTHGHLFAVKSTLMNLYYRARELGADIVCFGHSHMLGMEMVDDILFINPGSVRLPRGRKEQTYVILELDGERADVTVYDVQQGELEQLKRQFIFSKK